MNGMTTGQAVQNLDNLLAQSRLTRQEHVVMQQSLQLLQMKAAELDRRAEESKKDTDAKEEVDNGDTV